MKQYIKSVLLSVFSGFLMAIGWCNEYMSFLILFSFVPLFFIEAEKNISKSVKFVLYYLAFLIFNVKTTYWIIYASFAGGVAAMLINAFFMAIILNTSFIIKNKKRLNTPLLHFYIIPLWITFEYIHLNWELAWPWLTLGNTFANNPILVQWYEYTGVLGGSLWILLVNVMIWRLFEKQLTMKIQLIKLVGVILMPILVSLILYYYNNGSQKIEVNVLVVQPNIDPYNEKFNGTPNNIMFEKFKVFIKNKLDENIDYIVFPETALPISMQEGYWNEDPVIDSITKFISVYPNTMILIGATTYRLYGENVVTSTARYNELFGGYYDIFNTALQIDGKKNISIYHKSKLVPGVEILPYKKLFGFLDKLMVDLGGTRGSLGYDDDVTVFAHNHKNIKIAPVICYESVFGDYITKYVRKGANIITVITNDGWWGDTYGYKQHFAYARLRAIETRRYVIQAANTGISGIIDDRGNIIYRTNYWCKDIIKSKVASNNNITLYVRYGDYIGLFSTVISLIVLLYYFILVRLKKHN